MKNLLIWIFSNCKPLQNKQFINTLYFKINKNQLRLKFQYQQWGKFVDQKQKYF